MTSNASIHSDLLVHWTGRDIDTEFDPNWATAKQYKMKPSVARRYFVRLRDILRHGLWVTTQKAEIYGTERVCVPEAPGLCFTELKLSQSRTHALRFGRLGIAVKRPFVFNRGGRPMVYFNGRGPTDPFMKQCIEHFRDRSLLQFFKPMDKSSSGRMGYEYFDESEWRIVPPAGERPKWIVDPRTSLRPNLKEWFEEIPSESRHKLHYLVPLDGWLAAIIYPSHIVKNFAHDDRSEIRCLLSEIAKVGRKFSIEGLNLPAELDLDLCRHF